ncbi:MAG TPA: heme peroxidase family protein [Stellaceae bacterium]|jgi:hypothetical protein
MDPFKQLTHGGVLDVAEILFHTRFDYMFPLLAENPDWLLPPGANTQGALLALGMAMATDDLTQSNDSTIPAIFTYFGQFIDHNITAQTDREIGISRIATPDGNVMDLTPLPADEVAHKLINGRRPQLDLEQVYGDGPALGTGVNLGETEADILYDIQKRLKVVSIAAVPPGFDVPRQPDGTAIIADMRNNENLNVSQLQCAFLLFHNNIAAALPGSPSSDERYIRARRLARWAYQYVVVNDYLRAVCDPVVVDDILANGNRYYAPNSDTAFLPLEFSVAAFRFGHSMIRPAYSLNPTHTGASALPLSEILAVGSLLDGTGKLKSEFIIQWHNFAQIMGHPAPQMARRIDPLISKSLAMLPVFLPGSKILLGPLLQQLAQRNLMRGFLLSIPTGQAVAEAMDIKPLSAANLTDGVSPAISAALVAGEFQSATPLWYYVLQEARFQQNGNRLGSVGSRIVAETLIGLARKDRTSYLNNLADPAVTSGGINVAAGHVIATIADLLTFAGVPV